ncbi:Helix-turn-helix transcriptional regulator [Pararobbsia alpina]|uniref:helix-turn-helix domain-containing protein n=1 Tax=Pararobbsia alpina TaxID=621374 RepID=UPI0039A563F9
MALADLLVPTIKRLLRGRQLTYRHVADALDLSEPSVKRLFASKRLSLAHVDQLAELLGMTVVELVSESEAVAPRLQVLTHAQEATLVADEKQLLVAVCVINQWTVDDIVSTYSLSEAECIKYVLGLEKMGIVHLYPGNRIRLLIARDFDWLSKGPIRQFLRANTIPDFLADDFDGADTDSLSFGHGMLTHAACAQLRGDIERLRAKLAALHEASSDAPLSDRQGTALLVAMRSWEPAGFTKLRRDKKIR